MRWLLALGGALVAGLAGIVLLHERSSSPTAVAPSGGKVATISSGEAVDLESHLRPGTWTVVEFTADW